MKVNCNALQDALIERAMRLGIPVVTIKQPLRQEPVIKKKINFRTMLEKDILILESRG